MFFKRIAPNENSFSPNKIFKRKYAKCILLIPWGYLKKGLIHLKEKYNNRDICKPNKAGREWKNLEGNNRLY